VLSGESGGREALVADERITWDTCPCCGRSAAVGWLDGVAVEFDCPRECRPTESQIARLPHPGRAASLTRWTAAARRWA